VASDLIQLAYFGSFQVNTSFYTSRAVLGPQTMFFWIARVKLYLKLDFDGIMCISR
jgi:hypothetical protein